MIVLAAEIQDRPDPHHFQFLQPARLRLSAAIDLRIDLMKVWQFGVARITLCQATESKQHHTGRQWNSGLYNSCVDALQYGASRPATYD